MYPAFHGETYFRGTGTSIHRAGLGLHLAASGSLKFFCMKSKQTNEQEIYDIAARCRVFLNVHRFLAESENRKVQKRINKFGDENNVDPFNAANKYISLKDPK